MPKPKRTGHATTVRDPEALSKLLAHFEKQLQSEPNIDKQLKIARLYGQLREIERKGRAKEQGNELTREAVIAWATDLTPAERSELVRKLLSVDGPRGSGLA